MYLYSRKQRNLVQELITLMKPAGGLKILTDLAMFNILARQIENGAHRSRSFIDSRLFRFAEARRTALWRDPPRWLRLEITWCLPVHIAVLTTFFSVPI